MLWRNWWTYAANEPVVLGKFIPYGSTLDPGSSYAFVEKNRSSSKYIDLGEEYHLGDKKLDKLLRSLLQLPSLQELDLYYKIPQDILGNFRKQGVYCHDWFWWMEFKLAVYYVSTFFLPGSGLGGWYRDDSSDRIVNKDHGLRTFRQIYTMFLPVALYKKYG